MHHFSKKSSYNNSHDRKGTQPRLWRLWISGMPGLLLIHNSTAFRSQPFGLLWPHGVCQTIHARLAAGAGLNSCPSPARRSWGRPLKVLPEKRYNTEIQPFVAI